MRILAINTATNITEIALLEGKEILYEKSWESDYDEAEKVLPAIKTALKSSSEPPDRIFAVQGPGAFTGLRIGITIANAIAYVTGAKMHSCTTFEYLRAKIKPEYSKKTAIVLKAGGGFLARMKPDNKKHKIVKEIPRAKYILSDIKKSEEKKYPLPPGTKFLPISAQKKLSQILPELMKKFPEKHKFVTPYYLSPPQITKSKKECYT
jgi:tRNA threonylcarbamoyl adenosine modification protein YeaZ